MTANKSVTATFTLNDAPVTYTLSIVVSGQGHVALNPLGGSYAAGSVVTLTAVPSATWYFDSWSGDASGTTNPVTVTMTANKSVTATFGTFRVFLPLILKN